jgi:hypothetical protein
MPDYDADPCLWTLQGDVLWEDAPISAALRSDLDEWRKTWEEHCYKRGDAWDSRSTYVEWDGRGWQLWARSNRELIPSGWIVKADFAGYPERYWPSRGSKRHRWIHRFYREPISARQAQQIIAQSNEVLLHSGLPQIAPFFATCSTVKANRRRHWR